MTYLFFLGNAPELALAEIQSLLRVHNTKATFIDIEPKIVGVEVLEALSATVFEKLGGTIKVAEMGAEFEDIVKVLKAVESFLTTFDKRIVFGLSIHPALLKVTPPLLALDLKKRLEDVGHKVRFVSSKRPDWNLSSVVVTKQKVVEFVIVPGQNAQFMLAQTIWVQEFEDWGKRDYGRPAAEGHLGMLPPKVARMMVNLGLSESLPTKEIVLDPFCGVGTVLAESLVLGAQAIGIDQDPNQVKRSKDNLSWLSEQYGLEKNYQVHQGDARRTGTLIKTTVDAIVTEPYLGPNDTQAKKHNPAQLNTLMQQLIGLYVQCLDSWKLILKPGGRVVMALPSFTQSNHIEEHLVKTIVDKAKLMGYSLVQGPYPYFRAQAVVRRNITVFIKN